MIELRGITWNHTRGYLPMVATAQRFSELHPDISIVWEKRSLQQFADQNLAELASRFDLLVIDHPSIGAAFDEGLFLPMDEHLPTSFLENQASQSVGAAHQSYFFGNHQWALAIDAATPVSGWRPDLLGKAEASVPAKWSELLDLARKQLVAIPGIPIDSLMHFFMVCTGLGETPFANADRAISIEVGVQALEMLRELAGLVSPECALNNPIRIWEQLSTESIVAFCPFAYGYSNYSRPEYAAHPLEVGGLVTIDGHERCRSTLGGAGLAISSRAHHIGTAIEYCRFVASPECQAGLYFTSGGQPGNRLAWLDADINRAGHNFFRNTLPTLDEAWVRPRWNGYLEFQEAASAMVHGHIWTGGRARDVVTAMNELSQKARTKKGARTSNATA